MDFNCTIMAIKKVVSQIPQITGTGTASHYVTKEETIAQNTIMQSYCFPMERPKISNMQLVRTGLLNKVIGKKAEKHLQFMASINMNLIYQGTSGIGNVLY